MKKFIISLKTLFIASVFLLVLPSCNEWLDVEPQGELVQDRFWQKTSDVYGGLAATYDAMRGTSLNSIILGECRADLLRFSATNFSDYVLIAESNITPTNGATNWSQYYTAINLANTLMFYNKEVFEKDPTFTQEMLNGVDAEALFLRSLAYFYLVRLWKDVPLVLEPSISDTTNIYLPKSSEKTVIQQIINDLLVAKDLAYTTQFLGTPEFHGRANKYAIMALLADVYLWDEQYNLAMNYADSIIQTGMFELEESSNMFDVYYPGNSAREGIFEFQYNSNLDNQSNPIYNNLITTYGPTQVSLNGPIINMLFTQEDLRRFFGKQALWKYQGKDGLGQIGRTATEEDANWIVYRYAEILLIKAEAAIELGMFDVANTLLGEIALRAGTPYVFLNDKESLQDALLEERAREFILEGKRWFDILRAAKRDRFSNRQIIIDMILSGADVRLQAILRTKVFDTLAYYLPIHQNEINFNQNLEQNPYYD